MKKIVLSLVAMAALLGTLVSLPQLFAADAETGNLVIHFKKWNDEYTGLGGYTWAVISEKQTYDGLDDFGAYFEYSDIPVVAEDSTATIPFIAVNYAEGSPDWGNKFTSNILINQTVIKANKTTHVYVFQGRNDDPGKSTAENPRWFAADPDMHNMLLVYFDPTGNYDENLGVHNWGGWSIGDAGWSTPKKVFSTAGETEGGQVVKAAMLSIEPGDGGAVKDGGLLIYEGGDANKRTGDVKIQLAYGEGTHAVGTTAAAWVVSKGAPYTDGDNVFYGFEAYEDYAAEAFTFRLNPFTLDSNTGQPSGTYAVRPTQIIVKTSSPVNNLYAVAETAQAQAEALETMTSWFKVTLKGTQTELAIERVDFALRNSSVSDFVVVLAEGVQLDNTKQYVLSFNDGVNEAQIDVNMDTEGPEISFPLLDEDKIILVQWGQPFDLNDFPLYSAFDDRDGDVTAKVFVPAGPNAILDTRVEADYTIMLQVEDTWGNVTQVTFIFRVTKNPQA